LSVRQGFGIIRGDRSRPGIGHQGGKLFYQNGDDPQLLGDLRTALKRWRKPTLGDVPLALRLADVERRRTANQRLTRASALQESIRAALASLGHYGQAEHADLLERRYLHDQSVFHLQEVLHLGERSVYYRLEEALVALAHALWTVEQGEVPIAPSDPEVLEPSPRQWRARHLPPPVYTRLFGTDGILAQLIACLSDPADHWLISLDGMGGLGKTALAWEAAACLAETDRFADIAWLAVRPDFYSLNGPGAAERAALTCAQLLDGIGRQLAGMDLSSEPLPVKQQRVRGLLQSQPYLVVVDNLEMVTGCGDLPGWFWELGNPSKFLFTSRHRIEPYVGLTVLLLDQLAEHDALALIRYEGRLRDLHEVAEASDGALRPILAVAGGNPLVIKLIVGELVSLPLDRVLARLQEIGPGSDRLYEYLYGTAWGLLSMPARHILLQIAQLPTCGATWEELSAIAALTDSELASAVGELTTYSLVQPAGLERKFYSIHPLTHHFVLSKAGLNNGAGEVDPVVHPVPTANAEFSPNDHFLTKL
jgi:hypothetical protein